MPLLCRFFTRTRRLQYWHVIKVCLPLVLSLSATTAMEFTDRIFLANYSLETISAAMSAGVVSFLLLTFLGGVSGYVSVFVAQYSGCGNYNKIGSILWQALWFSGFSALLIGIVGLFAEPVFALAGHAKEVQQLECIYFAILCYGSLFHLLMVTFSAFFVGRGITRPVMIITFVGVIANIPLDYAMIFGRWGMPTLGIKGAAIATVFSWFINAVLLGILLFTRQNNTDFSVLSNWRFHCQRFLRLLRFGIPGALQFTLDVASFALFILLVGRISTDALAATNIVFSINSLSFMPAMGASQGASILVGRAVGKGKPEQAIQLVSRSAEILFCYVLFVGLCFLFFTEQILTPFFLGSGEESIAVYDTAMLLMHIVIAFIVFDAFYMLYSGALRGAGDTTFMMWAAALSGIFLMVLPVYVGITFFSISVVTAWFCVALFLFGMCIIAVLRYRSGKWKAMSVIEEV